MKPSVDRILSSMIDDASNGDWESAVDHADELREKIAQLRDRIDELGGYHDDI